MLATEAAEAAAAWASAAADELCVGSTFLDDLQIEFRQLQRAHHPDLSKEQWLELFRVWLEHYRARLEAERAARHARLDALWEERCSLFAQRVFLPLAQRAAVDQRIAAIAQEIAAAFVVDKPECAGAVWVPD